MNYKTLCFILLALLIGATFGYFTPFSERGLYKDSSPLSYYCSVGGYGVPMGQLDDPHGSNHIVVPDCPRVLPTNAEAMKSYHNCLKTGKSFYVPPLNGLEGGKGCELPDGSYVWSRYN